MKRITLEITNFIKPFMELVGFGQLLEYVEVLKLEKIYRFDIHAIWAVEIFKFKDPDFEPANLLDIDGIGITEIEEIIENNGNYTCLVKTEKENKFHELFTDFNLILPPDMPLILTQDSMKISFISYEYQLRTVLNQLAQYIPKKHLKVASIQDIKHEFSSYHSLLTPRQLEIVEAAVKNGYFELPKKVSAKDLAEKFTISVSAFNEHLRKAVRTIFEVLFRT